MRATAPCDAAAAYWASLGLLPDNVTENLQEVSVQIESLGGAGTQELQTALGKLGVRVVDRDAKLTVVLVNDYLEGRLAEFNRDRLSRQDKTWLPVQLSGIYSLVGPLFSRGMGACSDVSRRSDEVEPANQGIPRPQERPVRFCFAGLARSILPSKPYRPCRGRDCQGDRERRSHRLARPPHQPRPDRARASPSTQAALRPQCTACGSSELRDPQRAPTPIRLHVGGTPVVTSKGYRTLTPSATLANWRKQISPLTGVVLRLERIGDDLPANATYTGWPQLLVRS